MNKGNNILLLGAVNVGKVKLTPFQIFSLIILFELGSAIVFSIGVEAKQDAWIAILLGMVGSILLFFVYYYLFKQFPDLTLIEYIKKILGKHLGWVVGFLYTVYFLYIAVRVLRDFEDLIVTAILPETPAFIVGLLMTLTIIYVVYHGIEVLARTGEFYFLIFLLIGLVVNFLYLVSGVIDIENILPFLGEGWKPILDASFPQILTFPFGEIIVFTMLFPLLNNKKSALKVAIFGLVISGLLIAFSQMMNIAVLGVDIVERSSFPLLSSISKIQIGDFLERLDALAVISLIVGLFFKISIFTYAGVVGASILFKVKRYQTLLFPISMIVLGGSMSISESLAEHLDKGFAVVPDYLHLPFQIYIPLVLLVITIIRKKYFKTL
ncbi:GerAB/ArcD/ProY family transporter [Salipaludibacillus sp. HK11]|uniref:GerAB/ArcD/ProY family transporter n=1 Tax=Salipaludibacillus sp. HK11 TaxID=3394320 RepID=UPI0039FCF572